MPHTPGPWRVDGTKALGAYGVWTDYSTHPGHDGEGYPSQICSFTIHGISENKNRDADARLISASPDLLAALKGFLHADPDVFRDELAAARAVISKAEGTT